MRRTLFALLSAVVLGSAGCTVAVPGSDLPATSSDWAVEPLADGLEHVWDIAELPDGGLLVTERPGRLSIVGNDGALTPLEADLGDVFASGEAGLMGLALSPGYAEDRRFYTCLATTDQDVKVVGWTLDAEGSTAARDAQPLLSGLPLSSSGRHSGCRLVFGPDGMLYVGTGDSAQGTNPQDLHSLGGKVLRVDPATGQPPADNPFLGSTTADPLVYTYGHRNVQGLAVRPETGQLFAAEHGPDVDDEVNLLEPGGNYGWDPDGSGSYDESVPMTDPDLDGAIEALWSSGEPTVALCGIAFLTGGDWGDYEGALVASTLKGTHLMVLTLDGDEVTASAKPEALDGTYGRLRAITIGADGTLYVGTSNGDDDKILRVTPG